MLSQTSAFLTRSIRQESRLLSHHMVRGGMVVMMLYLLFLQVVETARFGAAGLTLIGNVIQCCYWCLTLLGVMYFAVAITEEKEEETLPLLRMTGVRDVTLLLGKSLPRLAVVILLILIAAPFLMLAVTLGGVVREQIFSSLVGLICYAFCLCQAGLFCQCACLPCVHRPMQRCCCHALFVHVHRGGASSPSTGSMSGSAVWGL